MKTNDRIAFVYFEERLERSPEPNCNNHNDYQEEENVESENPEELPKTVKKTISNQLFSNVWLTFMLFVAGGIHFYATFREIAPTEMNIPKDDLIFVANVALCDFFNAFGKMFWSYFSAFTSRGMNPLIDRLLCISDLLFTILYSTRFDIIFIFSDVFSIKQVKFTSNLMMLISSILIILNLSLLFIPRIR